MSWHLGPGPVFTNECVLTARRRQLYFTRTLTGLMLSGLVLLIYASSTSVGSLETTSNLTEQARARDIVGQALITAILVLQIALIVFVAPATMASAISVEKARGTLLHILVTDLRSHEIIFGKLAARFLNVLGIIGMSLPIFMILTMVVSIEPEMVLGGYMVLIGVAALYSAIGLTVSVYGQKPHEVLIASMLLIVLLLLLGPAWILFVYLVTERELAFLIIVGTLAAMVAFVAMLIGIPASRRTIRRIPFATLAYVLIVVLITGLIAFLREILSPQSAEWLMPTNPFFMAFYRYAYPNDPNALKYQAIFLIAHLALAGLLVLACTLRLRTVVVAQAGDGGTRKPRSAQKALAKLRRAEPAGGGVSTADAALRLSFWQRLLARLPGPRLDGNPVLWREWHRRRPSKFMRGVWTFIGSVAVFFWVLSCGSIPLGISYDWRHNPLLILTVTGIIIIGLLLVSISSVGSLLEERQRGSLDVLMTTPLSTGQIIWGKWLGAYRTAVVLLALPILLLLWYATCVTQFGQSYLNSSRFGIGSTTSITLGELWTRVLAMSSLFLSWGAWVTTVGLALSVFIRRIALATLVSVSLFVMLAIGVPLLLALLLPGTSPQERDWFNCILVGTPFGGAGFLTEELISANRYLSQSHRMLTQTAWIWAGFFALASMLVYCLVWVHFNHLMGRADSPGSSNRILRMSRSTTSTLSNQQPVTSATIR